MDGHWPATTRRRRWVSCYTHPRSDPGGRTPRMRPVGAGSRCRLCRAYRHRGRTTMPVPNSLACGCPAQAAEDRLGPATVFRSGGSIRASTLQGAGAEPVAATQQRFARGHRLIWPGQIRRVAPSWMAQSSATSSVPGRRSGGAVLPFPTRGRDLTSGSSISCTLGISNYRAWCQAYSRRFSAPARPSRTCRRLTRCTFASDMIAAVATRLREPPTLRINTVHSAISAYQPSTETGPEGRRTHLTVSFRSGS